MARREFGARVKFAALKRACDENGIPHCEKCTKILRAGDLFYDHKKPDGLGGEPTLENCAVLCGACHGEKTTKEDRPIMARADKKRKSHFGAKARKGRPIPGSKASGWKRTFDGRVIKRET